MLKYALLAAAIGGGVYFVAKSMTPTQTTGPGATVAQIAADAGALAGAANTVTSTIKGWFASKPAATSSAPNTSTSAVARTVAGQTPYGTPSSSDGDAAISDAMGVAAARSSTPYPNLFQTRAQSVFSGVAVGVSPFASRS